MHTSRSLRAACSLLGCLLAASLVGCDGGTLPSSGGGGGGSDGGGGGGGAGPDAGPTAGVDAAPAGGGADAAPPAACDSEVIAGLSSGHHNSGQPCLNSGCHAPGGGGPTFTAAGTMYSAVTGGSTLRGATIHLIDGNGNDVTLVSNRNGNFYTSQSLAFPLQARASLCPDSLMMSTQLQSGQGNCNSSGCHDNNNRVHLP